MASSDGPNWGAFATAGLEIAVGVGVGYVVGSFIDRKLNCSPWGVLAGILLGVAAGSYLLIKEAIRANGD